MRETGEQWVKEVDGVQHMVKAVVAIEEGTCIACDFECQLNKCSGIPDNLCGQDSDSYILKDLGPVNEEGCLAEERTGLFPAITKVNDGIWKASVYQNSGLIQIEIEVWATTKQGVIDAWNRRAM